MMKITFPMKYPNGTTHKIMVNGSEIGWCIRNCQDMWHFKFTIGEKEHNLWFEPWVNYNTAKGKARIEIEKLYQAL